MSRKPARAWQRAGILLFWLLLWQGIAWKLGQPIFLVGPWEAAQALVRLGASPGFWQAAFSSLGRVGAGFLLAFLGGIACGGAGYAFPWFALFLAPVVSLMKTVPVASFVILALIWAGAKNLAVIISFLVVFPIIYLNTTAGLRSADRQLLEMAQVFRVRPLPKIWQIYRPALAPYLLNACRVALGMAWKSGIAAEVIGTPARSIGEQLYMAKVFFSTDELFAWTAAVVALSFLFERAVLVCLKKAMGTETDGTETDGGRDGDGMRRRRLKRRRRQGK